MRSEKIYRYTGILIVPYFITCTVPGTCIKDIYIYIQLYDCILHVAGTGRIPVSTRYGTIRTWTGDGLCMYRMYSTGTLRVPVGHPVFLLGFLPKPTPEPSNQAFPAHAPTECLVFSV